jgi:hypothetical protein
MARKGKGGVNVSAAIRNYLEANKDVGPTAAAEAISKELGRKVTSTYVSNIKSTMSGGGKKKGRKGRKPGPKTARISPAARASSNGTVELKSIVAVKELLVSMGADRAKELIDLLA